jgi:hypothetical protein
VIEQEATVLRTKIQTLESDNEKLAAENKQLQLLRLKKGSTETEAEIKGKITSLETELVEAYNKVTWCSLFLWSIFLIIIHWYFHLHPFFPCYLLYNFPYLVSSYLTP